MRIAYRAVWLAARAGLLAMLVVPETCAGAPRSLGRGLPVVADPARHQRIDSEHPDRALLPDGSGGWWLGFLHDATVGVTRLDATGHRREAWPDSGRTFAASGYLRCCDYTPSLEHADDGVYLTSQSFASVRSIRLDASGLPEVGWQDGGTMGKWFWRPLWATYSAGAVTDQVGGIYLAGQLIDTRPSSRAAQVAVQRWAPDGRAPLWWNEVEPLVLDDHVEPYNPVTIAADRLAAYPSAPNSPRPGAFVAWIDSTAFDSVAIRLSRIEPSSVPAPGWPAGGILVRQALLDHRAQRSVALCSDGRSGVHVAWIEAATPSAGRNPTRGITLPPTQVRTAHFSVTGERSSAQPAEGYAIRSGPYDLQPQLAPDGEGGMFVAGFDATDGSLWLQRIRAEGVRADAWPESGLLITRPGEIALDTPTLVADGERGALLAWRELLANFSCTIRIRRVGPNAAAPPGWSPEGAATEVAPRLFGSRPALGVDSRSGIVVAWAESRAVEFDADIYVAKLALDGTPSATTLPAPRARFVNVTPSPARGPVRALLSLAERHIVRTRVLDITGRVIRQPDDALDLPRGVHALTWDGRDANGGSVRPGVYLLAAYDRTSGTRLASTAVVVAR